MTSWQRQKFGAKKVETPVLHPSVSCHTWNKDRTQIALSANDSKILIYQTNKEEDLSKWKLLHTLTEHGGTVTCLSWAPNTNRILSCSQDRNAYVWTLENDVWKPVLVLLRIRRAATSCAWSVNEDKFAVGSGQKIVSVCFFDPQNNWWVSKVTKKGLHKSTVTCVAFHPKDNTMLLTGCSDFKCRYFSGFIKLVDKKDQKKGELGKLFGEWGSKGWILSCAFSPDGNTIAFSGHDSTITVTSSTNPENVSVIYYKGLPFNSLVFLSNTVIVAAGYDRSPYLFALKGDKWDFVGAVEAEEKSDQKSNVSKFGASKFQSTNQDQSSTEMDTKHKMGITEIQKYSVDANGNVSKFSTCGLDGRVMVWDVKEFAKKFSDLKL